MVARALNKGSCLGFSQLGLLGQSASQPGIPAVTPSFLPQQPNAEGLMWIHRTRA